MKLVPNGSVVGVVMLGLGLSACAVSEGESAPESEESPGPVAELGDRPDVFSLGSTFVQNGKTWENTGYVDYLKGDTSQQGQIFGPPPRNTDELIMEMTLEEAAEFLKPVTEIGHYTYEPSREDALEFARVVRESISQRLTMEAPGEDAQEGFEDREDRQIIPGFGSWSLINSSADNSPYSRIASMDQGAGFCTAEKLINHHTAVTAAHCVQDSSENWMSRQRLRFAAGSANTANGGSDDAMPYLPSGCYARTVPGCWNGTTGTCDYAVLTLRGAFGAWCDYDDYNVGYFGYTTVNNEYTAMTVRTSGYPGTPPSGSYPGLSYHRRTDGETNNNAWLYYHNDTNGGQSGGPVFDDSNKMRATHVGFLSGSWNVGMRLTTTVINFFDDYKGS